MALLLRCCPSFAADGPTARLSTSARSAPALPEPSRGSRSQAATPGTSKGSFGSTRVTAPLRRRIRRRRQISDHPSAYVVYNRRCCGPSLYTRSRSLHGRRSSATRLPRTGHPLHQSVPPSSGRNQRTAASVPVSVSRTISNPFSGCLIVIMTPPFRMKYRDRPGSP